MGFLESIFRKGVFFGKKKKKKKKKPPWNFRNILEVCKVLGFWKVFLENECIF
jgi:hypothetical protein